jgi:hypothetical protein
MSIHQYSEAPKRQATNWFRLFLASSLTIAASLSTSHHAAPAIIYGYRNKVLVKNDGSSLFGVGNRQGKQETPKKL